MITFRQEKEIIKPLDMVIRVFSDRDQMIRWQPGLVSVEPMEGAGPRTFKLTFQLGRRRMPMTETIESDQLPAQYIVTYDMKGVFNRVKHSFVATETGTTLWRCDHEFRFKGLMKLVVVFIRGDFEKQSDIIMRNFKGYVESL